MSLAYNTAFTAIAAQFPNIDISRIMDSQAETDVEGKSPEASTLDIYISRDLRADEDGTYNDINAIYSDSDKLAAFIKAINTAFTPEASITATVTASTLSKIVPGVPTLPTFTPEVTEEGVTIDIEYLAPGMVYRYWEQDTMDDDLSDLSQFIDFKGDGRDHRIYFSKTLKQTQEFKPDIGKYSFYLIVSEAHPDPMVASFNPEYQWVGFEILPAPVPGDLTIAVMFGG